jgi:hypothetical protein
VSENCAYPGLAVFNGGNAFPHLADFLPMYVILALCFSWASAHYDKSSHRVSPRSHLIAAAFMWHFSFCYSQKFGMLHPANRGFCKRFVKTMCTCLILTPADLDWMEASCFDSSWLSPASVLQIIQVNLTSDVPKPLTPGTSLEFTYSVRWEASTIPFAKRFERYLDYNFFEHQVTRCGGRGRNKHQASACLYFGV